MPRHSVVFFIRGYLANSNLTVLMRFWNVFKISWVITVGKSNSEIGSSNYLWWNPPNLLLWLTCFYPKVVKCNTYLFRRWYENSATNKQPRKWLADSKKLFISWWSSAQKTIHYTFVRLHLEYGQIIWNLKEYITIPKYLWRDFIAWVVQKNQENWIYHSWFAGEMEAIWYSFSNTYTSTSTVWY